MNSGEEDDVESLKKEIITSATFFFAAAADSIWPLAVSKYNKNSLNNIGRRIEKVQPLPIQFSSVLAQSNSRDDEMRHLQVIFGSCSESEAHGKKMENW